MVKGGKLTQLANQVMKRVFVLLGFAMGMNLPF
jgi:hypothetical protein